MDDTGFPKGSSTLALGWPVSFLSPLFFFSLSISLTPCFFHSATLWFILSFPFGFQSLFYCSFLQLPHKTENNNVQQMGCFRDGGHWINLLMRKIIILFQRRDFLFFFGKNLETANRIKESGLWYKKAKGRKTNWTKTVVYLKTININART